jgi:ferrous iron transport protein B
VRPLGWDWKIGMATLASFPAREVIIAALGTIYNLGSDQKEGSVELRQAMQAERWPDGRPIYTPVVALSIMVFFALCCQCGATLATIKRETGSWGYAVFTFAYMTSLAYLGALAVYQIGSHLV